ncbi:Hexosyltransferase [Caligus rogercresseyi]|uniref:Hexosyltransferase n=1 Tax=Caligus rogercresseyi TaxID=217165 RepID=A0A7T8GTG1_CALRO|nr:Hexosyltransferase [Caligus rogercresseyi]
MKPSARIIFIIEKLKDTDKIPNNLQKEIDTHGDILQVDFIDSYYNLTLKTVASLRFAWLYNECGKTPPEFIMTMDDDVFLNVPPFFKLLNGLSKDCPHPLFGGRFQYKSNCKQVGSTQLYAFKWRIPSLYPRIPYNNVI